ncbi:MAG: zinc ribbon domain-containing protein [Methanoregula sp.]
MTYGQKFCTECGEPLVPDTRFCGHCGSPVAGMVPTNSPAASPAPAPQQPPVLQGAAIPDGPEQIIGIVPFLEQGLISVIHYTLLVTPQRLIFCTWNPDNDEAMSDADDEMTLESCNIEETPDEIAHFQAKDWAVGPWQRYLSMPIDAITANAPGSILLPISGIAGVDITCETRNSTQDTLLIDAGGRRHTFDLMYSQGPFLFRLLKPLLGERVRMTDPLE